MFVEIKGEDDDEVVDDTQTVSWAFSRNAPIEAEDNDQSME